METTHKPTILVVDDSTDNLTLLNELLQDRYEVKLAINGKLALRVAAKSPPPDLILLDVMMPEMDGYEVCAKLKADPATAAIPSLFLTAKSQTNDEQRGFQVGAVDYITKPINPVTLMARVSTHLRLRQATQFLEDRNLHLEQLVALRTADIAAMQDATILAMASLAETRDNDTGNHIRRTQHYVRALATALQTHPRFADELTDANIELLFKSAPLHDIGKVGIPDSILLKPGKLTDEEFTIMKRHPEYGRDVILSVEAQLGGSNTFLRYAREIAYSHQEKFNGSGYPLGLVGDAIPLSARLMAVADVYDALISKRVYKPAFSHEDAMRLMLEGRGRHFDPDVIDAMVRLETEFREIAGRYADQCFEG